MIKVYVLPITTENNSLVVAGVELTAGGLLTYGTTPETATLVVDATPDEHTALSGLALEVRDPTLEEIYTFQSIEEEPPPSPDYLRACELLAQSPPVITMPAIWELLRIFGRRLGYPFEK